MFWAIFTGNECYLSVFKCASAGRTVDDGACVGRSNYILYMLSAGGWVQRRAMDCLVDCLIA